MEVKKKDMQKTNWSRCLEKEYYSKEFKFDNFEGIVSLSILKKLTAPLIIHYPFGDTLIADNNYKHLQFAFRNQYFWLTAMYDDKDELIELYFDITKGNNFDNLDNPYFYDMFLDIVVTKNKEIYIVDKDELQIALEENTICKEEYDKAFETANWLYNYLIENRDNVIDYCYRCLKEME